MNCGRCREWALLVRPGELDRRSERELEKHLAGCRDCREARRRAGLTERAAALLRESPPIPSAGMTDRILAAVRKEGRPKPARPARFFPSRPVRFGLAGAAAAAVLFFAGQEFMVMSRVSRLENKMAALSTARPAGGERWLELQSGLTAGGSAADEWVAVRRSDLEALAGRYPDDPAVRSLIGRVERITRPGTAAGEGAVRLENIVRRLEKDPLVVEWMKKMEKQGGLSWNRI
jgi:hypothetical protein